MAKICASGSNYDKSYKSERSALKRKSNITSSVDWYLIQKLPKTTRMKMLPAVLSSGGFTQHMQVILSKQPFSIKLDCSLLPLIFHILTSCLRNVLIFEHITNLKVSLLSCFSFSFVFWLPVDGMVTFVNFLQTSEATLIVNLYLISYLTTELVAAELISPI